MNNQDAALIKSSKDPTLSDDLPVEPDQDQSDVISPDVVTGQPQDPDMETFDHLDIEEGERDDNDDVTKNGMTN